MALMPSQSIGRMDIDMGYTIGTIYVPYARVKNAKEINLTGQICADSKGPDFVPALAISIVDDLSDYVRLRRLLLLPGC